jgi:hypothetical protein
MNNLIDILRRMGNGFAAANRGEYLHTRPPVAVRAPS